MEVLSSPSMLDACFRASISLFLSCTPHNRVKLGICKNSHNLNFSIFQEIRKMASYKLYIPLINLSVMQPFIFEPSIKKIKTLKMLIWQTNWLTVFSIYRIYLSNPLNTKEASYAVFPLHGTAQRAYGTRFFSRFWFPMYMVPSQCRWGS